MRAHGHRTGQGQTVLPAPSAQKEVARDANRTALQYIFLEMLRTVAIGTGVMVTLMPTVKAAIPVDKEPQKPAPMKPSELPIYESPHADYAEFIEEKSTKKQVGQVRSLLMEPITSVRQSVQSVLEQTDSVRQTISDNIHEFQDRTDWIVKYLREEENKDIRYGAVGMGGLTGFIFGLRGGIIRRVFYAGIGTTIMGAVCFPEETKELAHQNGVLAKQYINIAYNFLYGVKPGDPQLELKFPDLHIPQNFSEFADLTKSLASSVKTMLTPPPAKEEPAAKKE
ncbi:apolipoprotein O domain-containing protein [Phthorimaea operculella]|nr:apolipoprotein O domain-containing protein [Phthorimaea operculella]